MNAQIARVRDVQLDEEGDEASGEQWFQPFLHDLVCTLRAPAFVLSAKDGQLGGGVQGYYVADRRALSRLIVSVEGSEPAPLGHELVGGSSARFSATVRGLGDRGADPTVLVERQRGFDGLALVETIVVTSFARAPVSATLSVSASSDLAEIAAIKSGRPVEQTLRGQACPGGLRWDAPGGSRVELCATPPPDTVDPLTGTLGWAVSVPSGASVSVVVRAEVSPAQVGPAGQAPTVLPVHDGQAPPVARVRCEDARLPRLLEQSLADLAALRLRDPLQPADVFLAAGAPWFLTLFGRDSIWAARMLLPLGTTLASGTLRTLARRQGTRVDTATAQEPGKIPHEIRSGPIEVSDVVRLPPLYYGTVDATPLWAILLHDAWRWGMPGGEVEALLDNLERALEWMSEHALGRHGFLQYADKSGSGLSNQGWKDSGDSIQFADGSLAEPPVALCEVQAYAYEAACKGADLLEAFGRAGAARWREFAARLAERFRSSFWVDSPTGPFPAIALDGRGRPVDTITSNLGHLLGTGLLDQAETDLVVEHLGSEDMNSGFGLRTMSRSSGGFNPLSYHGGSVWTHDTAIAVLGLRRVGTARADETASRLIQGLLAAAEAFEWRLPELYGGQSAARRQAPLPYPAACRPQAWSAAAAVSILQALTGLHADVPGNQLWVAPLRPAPVGAIDVHGLMVGEHRVSVHVDAEGTPRVDGLPARMRVHTQAPARAEPNP